MIQESLFPPLSGIHNDTSDVAFCLPQIRNKLNQEQNSKLQQQKELLNKRNMEVTLMDKRISELRERLYKKKAEARQKENLPVRLRALNTFPPSDCFCSKPPVSQLHQSGHGKCSLK